ncbi:hypothetical protein H8D30_07015 [bacterium]|nr:hypothetical protein [bacterium]
MKGALPYLFVVVAVVVGLLTLGGGDPHRYHQSHGLMGHETNEVLPAHRYPAGVVRETYQMAAEVSEVIDQLFCYCFCSDHSGHKCLLTCFTNDHFSNCSICIN